LKNREFDKEAPQNFCLERVTIAGRQGTSEDKNSKGLPMQSKTDSSSCLGIYQHSYIIPQKKPKSGQNNPKNRRTLKFARGLLC